MTERVGHLPGTSEIAANAFMCAAAVTIVAALTAAAVAAVGGADEVRRSLRFDFPGAVQTPAAVLQIAAQNARLAAAALLCAAVVPRLPRPARFVADAALSVLLAVNAGLVGLALGAYGARLAVAATPHMPVEFAALSLAGGAYMRARRHPVSTAAFAIVGTTCALLIVIAATLETYVAPGGAP